MTNIRPFGHEHGAPQDACIDSLERAETIALSLIELFSSFRAAERVRMTSTSLVERLLSTAIGLCDVLLPKQGQASRANERRLFGPRVLETVRARKTALVSLRRLVRNEDVEIGDSTTWLQDSTTRSQHGELAS